MAPNIRGRERRLDVIEFLDVTGVLDTPFMNSWPKYVGLAIDRRSLQSLSKRMRAD